MSAIASCRPGWPGVFLAAALAALLGGCEPKNTIPPASGPNVIVVLVDALRADRLGAYGRVPSITPVIDRLAQTSIVFENAYSNATWTAPSTASLFTSTLPTVHRISRAPIDDSSVVSVLDDNYVLFNEILWDAGYQTGMITTIGWVSETSNYDQGADVVIRTKRGDDEVVRLAGEFISESRDRPFHLYLHLIDLHDYFWPRFIFDPEVLGDREVSPEFLELRKVSNTAAYRTLSGELNSREALGADGLALLEHAYDLLVSETDRVVGELVRKLEEEGILEDTLLVITSDHGEQFLEHGRLLHGADGFYNEVLKVPFIVAGPGHFDDRRTVTTPVTTIDIAPTILDLLEVGSPRLYQGRSVLSKPDSDREVFATDGTTWKVITREWSYIASRNSGREELYRLADDPGELVDLAQAEEYQAVRERFRRSVSSAREASRDHEYLALVPNPEKSEMSPDEQRALRALGYLD